MINDPRIETYSVFTPISLLTKKFGQEFIRETNVTFLDDMQLEEQLKGISYFFPETNTLVKIISKISTENPTEDSDGVVEDEGSWPITSDLVDKIDWEFSMVIPRREFPAIHNIFNQIEYYTNYYFSAVATRNKKLAALELSEEVTITLPCEVSKLILMTWRGVGSQLDFKAILTLLGFDYQTSIKDIEEDWEARQLISDVVGV